jgi:hypothetical protein
MIKNKALLTKSLAAKNLGILKTLSSLPPLSLFSGNNE